MYVQDMYTYTSDVPYIYLYTYIGWQGTSWMAEHRPVGWGCLVEGALESWLKANVRGEMHVHVHACMCAYLCVCVHAHVCVCAQCMYGCFCIKCDGIMIIFSHVWHVHVYINLITTMLVMIILLNHGWLLSRWIVTTLWSYHDLSIHDIGRPGRSRPLHQGPRRWERTLGWGGWRCRCFARRRFVWQDFQV